MDQYIGHSQRNTEMQQAVMTENTERINARVQETVAGVQSTVHRALEGFKQMQTTGDGAKTAIDEVLERVKGTVNEMVERMKPATDLLSYAQQNPWLLVGGAVLMGYVLGGLAREDSSAH
jgi:ElaB/YqjD/DUF883 family membrane-anchored ribosome-binding protein